MKPALIIGTTIVLLSSIFSVPVFAQAQGATAATELLAKKIAPEDYTLQHASIDMENIYTRLVASTQTLQQTAEDFTKLVDRLEEKQAQHQVALAKENTHD